MPIRPFANAPIPASDPISSQPRKELTEAGQTDTLAGLVSTSWNEWFGLLSGQVNTSVFVQNSVSLEAQAASIAATDFTGGSLTGGLYFLAYYSQVTQAASVSSSLQVTLGWTTGGNTLSFAGTILTGNTITTGTSQIIMVPIDAGSPVTFSVAYASVGGTPMQYRVIPVIMAVPVTL